MIQEISPYLVTNGNGQEAVEFYKDVLQAELISFQTFGENPMEGHSLPEEAKDMVLHAHLKIGGSVLMISDNFPGRPYQVGNHLSIAIMIKGADNTKAVFAKLEQGGEVEMPLQETFWSPLYGQVQDRFGILWKVSTTEN
ncbi:VOC family protein [Ornithinibacillus halotolerans]|uniref:VOC family protein n=1 Tax=Ornithinibacillus halotolerans TaxID=1274357 RepID=A0A916S4T8_9BACI|nr:glyoxalase/bleomycin resistance/extradiol dioxygenase family protein [Ornithinibacillus halotolerans]GGA83393.1 VOC family protein [Ornithinibacillus halotolerans]